MDTISCFLSRLLDSSPALSLENIADDQLSIIALISTYELF